MARTTDHLARGPMAPRPTPTGIDHVYAGYFAFQAAVGVLLWVLYAASSTVRSWAGLVSDPEAVTTAFAYPDLGLIVVGSLLSAWAIAGRRGQRRPVQRLHHRSGAVPHALPARMGGHDPSHRHRHTGHDAAARPVDLVDQLPGLGPAMTDQAGMANQLGHPMTGYSPRAG